MWSKPVRVGPYAVQGRMRRVAPEENTNRPGVIRPLPVRVSHRNVYAPWGRVSAGAPPSPVLPGPGGCGWVPWGVPWGPWVVRGNGRPASPG